PHGLASPTPAARRRGCLAPSRPSLDGPQHRRPLYSCRLTRPPRSPPGPEPGRYDPIRQGRGRPEPLLPPSPRAYAVALARHQHPAVALAWSAPTSLAARPDGSAISSAAASAAASTAVCAGLAHAPRGGGPRPRIRAPPPEPHGCRGDGYG